jgi:hypothetical protein
MDETQAGMDAASGRTATIESSAARHKERMGRGHRGPVGAAIPFEGGEAGEDHDIPNHGAERSRGLGQPDVSTG